MPDLVSWLREQVEADRQAARASLDERDSDWWWGPDAESASERHIARWNPTHVLAECDAKERILEDYRITVAAVRRVAGENIYEPGLDAMYAGRDALASCVRLLAAPYSDRPGYQPEWSPT